MKNDFKKGYNNYEPQLFKKLWNYDPEKGSFTWKKRYPNISQNRNFNSQFEDKNCFLSKTNTGYSKTKLFGEYTIMAHHVAWVITYGKIPKGLIIDHINGNRSDNRISNLRLVTHQENMRNINKHRTNNTSGKQGVHFRKDRNTWRARIKIDGEYILLGDYKNKEDAIKARKDAENKYEFIGTA